MQIQNQEKTSSVFSLMNIYQLQSNPKSTSLKQKSECKINARQHRLKDKYLSGFKFFSSKKLTELKMNEVKFALILL